MQKNYLVIQLARMGDLIQSKRLILSLEKSGLVWLVVDSSLKQLAELIYPRARILDIPAHAGEKADPLSRLDWLKKQLSNISGPDFSLVFNLNFSGLNFALSRLFPPEIMRGYFTKNGQEMKSKWARMAFNMTRSRSVSAINLVDLWALHAPDPISPEKVNPQAEARGTDLCVILAGRSQRRSIPTPALRGIVLALQERTNAGKIVLLGGKQDKDKAKRLANALPKKYMEKTENLTGETGWPELIRRLESAAAVITPDTGPMHLAAHVGVPVWAFFFSSAWCFETGPYGPGHRILQTVPPCAPCLENRECRFDLACHKLLSDPGLLRFLLGKTSELPEDMLCLQSFTDALGTYYTPVSGKDPYQKERDQLRSCLLDFHLPQKLGEGMVKPETAARLFPEREWILAD
jgi:ADP-heptose:LPS heptosyltransferase